MTYRSPLKSSGTPQSIQSAVGGRPMAGIAEQSVETQLTTDTTELDALQAQILSLQAQLAVAQAQNAADAQTIAGLQAQVTALQAQVAALQAQAAIDAQTIASLQVQVTALQNYINSLGLDKMAYFKVLTSYSEVGGGIYVPPSYNDVTVNYTPVLKLEIKTLPTYSTLNGGYP